MSQAGLSAGISQLENAVGELLFRREKAKTLILTPAGHAFADAALRALKELQELEESATTFRKVLSGTLQLGCFHSLSPLLLPNLAEQFAEHHPQVNLKFLEAAPHELERELRDGRCEAIIMYRHHLAQNLTCYPLGEHPLYIALHPDHPFAERDDLKLQELADEPYVLLDQEPISTNIVNTLRRNFITTPPRLTSRSIETIRSFVARGLGFALIGVRPPNDRSREGFPIVFKKLHEQEHFSEIVLCIMPEDSASRRVEVSISFLKEYLKEFPI